MAYRPEAKDFFSQNDHGENDTPSKDQDTNIPHDIDDDSYLSLSDTLLNDNASIQSEPSLLLNTTYDNHSEIYSLAPEDTSEETIHDDTDDDENCTIFSHFTSTTNTSETSDTATVLGDKLPKSFLQLSGISVANFNMRCNFRVEKALSIMIHYELETPALLYQFSAASQKPS